MTIPVIASDDAEFADHTLSAPGDAIFNDARMVRAIIRQVTSQRLGEARGPQTGVGEEQVVYRAGQARLPVDSLPHPAWLLPHTHSGAGFTAGQNRGRVAG